MRTRPGIEVSLDTRVKALREAGGPTAQALGTFFLFFVGVSVLVFFSHVLSCRDLPRKLLKFFIAPRTSSHGFSALFSSAPIFYHIFFSPLLSLVPSSLFSSPLISSPNLSSPQSQAYVRVRRSAQGTVKVESRVLWDPGSTTH